MRLMVLTLSTLVTVAVLATPAGARRAGFAGPTTVAATAITDTSATLHATPADLNVLSFDYGPTTGYGTTVTMASPGVGIDAAKAISGLSPSTTYFFRARTTAGNGAQLTFTTLGTLAPPPGSESADVGVTNAVVPATAVVGATLTYTFVVSNVGSQARNVQLTDPAIAGLTYLSASSSKGSCSIAGRVICTLGNLDNRQTVTITVAATATAAGSIANTVVVGADNPDPNVGANNRATSTVTVSAPAGAASTTSAAPHGADLSVKLAASFGTGASRPLTYTATIANAGPAAAHNVVLSTRLTTGRAVVVSAPNCRDTGHLVCTVGTIPAGSSVTVTIVLRPGQTRRATSYVNTARVTADETDPLAANNSTSVTTTVTAAR